MLAVFNKLNIELPYKVSNSSPEYIPKKLKTSIQIKTFAIIFIAALFTVAHYSQMEKIQIFIN